MKLGVSKGMLAGFAVELSLFGAAAVLSRDPVVVALLAGGLLMALGLSVVLSHRIAESAREMAAAAWGLAEGDVDQAIEVRTADDLGRTADALRAMVEHQRAMAAVADAIARGDLEAHVEPKSERDAFGHAFLRMRTSLRELVGRLEHQALYDPLTDLPNRTLLGDRLGHALRAARRDTAGVALLVLDLDRFKEVNDAFGHHHGDLLLVQAAARLGRVVRDGDTFARLGGDEFAVVLPGGDPAEAEHVAARIVAALREPFVVEGSRVEVGASVGIAAFPADGEDAQTLLRHADVAMYHAKAHHLGHTRYSAELDEATPERVALLPDLRHAIVTGGLELHYQPKLDVGGHGAHAVEALARWTHPERGPVAPDVFVPLAEQTGLVGDLTRWVLRTALAQCRTWEDDGLVLDVAVNVSVHDLRDAGLVDLVLRLLARHRLAPERLILEVTETALMADPQRARSTLDALRGLGVRIAIDDFGTGQSSLAYLRGLAASELKIDRTFVRDLSTDAGNEAIVRTTIALAHELGLRVVAEGVEDAPTLALLGEAGCDEAQGWLIGRPVPADAVPAALRAADPRALAV